MRALSLGVVVALIGLGVLERVSRADIVRRLLGTTTLGRSLTIHDVGTAASKGVPLGGPLATGGPTSSTSARRFVRSLVVRSDCWRAPRSRSRSAR